MGSIQGLGVGVEWGLAGVFAGLFVDGKEGLDYFGWELIYYRTLGS